MCKTTKHQLLKNTDYASSQLMLQIKKLSLLDKLTDHLGVVEDSPVRLPMWNLLDFYNSLKKETKHKSA